VVAGAVRAHQNVGADVFAMEGPQVRVAPRTALSLAMALHELATNAAKYGALSRPEGRVSIRWDIGPEPRVALEWREAGGPPVTPPARRGFGSRLIEEGLARELGAMAVMEFAPSGLVCRMSAALADA
jgi:two-component sensor histidine kinase